MKITLIRHAKTAGNLKKRYIGSTDEPILPDTAITKKYPKAEAVITSPLIRCKMTASLIYGDTYTVYQNLRETDFGSFENKSYEDLKNDPDYIAWLSSHGTLPFPNGESQSEFKERTISEFYRAVSDNFGKDMAIIVHGGTIMAIMQELFGGDFYDYQTENLGGYIIHINNGDNSYLTKNMLDYYEKI